MARIFKESQFYLHTPHSTANGMNHTREYAMDADVWSTDRQTDGPLDGQTDGIAL